MGNLYEQQTRERSAFYPARNIKRRKYLRAGQKLNGIAMVTEGDAFSWCANFFCLQISL
jgi:hypothetical protein